VQTLKNSKNGEFLGICRFSVGPIWLAPPSTFENQRLTSQFSRGAKRWIPSQNQWIGITWQRREHIFPYYDGALIAAFDLQCIVLVIKKFFFWFITTATKCKNSVQDSNSFYIFVLMFFNMLILKIKKI
jgi:hypothetical protein